MQRLFFLRVAAWQQLEEKKKIHNNDRAFK
jgi:hypothetical protein